MSLTKAPLPTIGTSPRRTGVSSSPRGIQHVSEVKTDVEILASKPPVVDEPQPAETKPAETKPAETKPVETKPVETKPEHIQTDDLEIETARQQVNVPANGLIVVGFLTCLTAIVPIFLSVKTLHDIYDSRITFATENGQTTLAFLPCQPIFVLGPIFSIWSLIVLNRESVKAAFHRKVGMPVMPREEPDENADEETTYVGVGVSIGIAFGVAIGVVMDDIGIGIALGVALGAAFGAAYATTKSGDVVSDPLPPSKPDAEFHLMVRRRLRIPATGLLVVGTLNLLATPVALLIPVFVQRSVGFDEGAGFVEGSSTFAEAVFLCSIFALASLGSGILLVLGSARMFDLQSHPMAIFAATIALLPIAIGFPLSLPLGIWALIVLMRHDVKATFADGR